MAYKNLSGFVEALELSGELVRIREPVSPKLEISEITDRVVKNNGKALLFENTGTDFPVLINAFASEKRMSLALGLNGLDEVGSKINRILGKLMNARGSFLGKISAIPVLKEFSSWMPRMRRGRGECQEVIMKMPDLGRIPVLTCWPDDGGPFITLPVVHTSDPETGIRNVGMYRMQVFGPDVTGMHWHMHKGSAHHYSKYKALGRKMPVTVTLGGDPVYTYAASAPLPENIDEYLFAGFLRGKRVELVKCITNDLAVPGDVDFVMEGYVDPNEELVLEGPFGDHTGFYSLPGLFPKFHITCLTHRRNAIYPATIVGIPPMEDAWMGKATERIFLAPIKMAVLPELSDMDMPPEGVFHNLALVSIEKAYPGHSVKVMSSLWGAGQMMFNKVLFIVNKDVDVHNYTDIAKIVSASVDPLQDIHFLKGPVDILDHSSRSYAYGSKMGIDATAILPDDKPEKIPGDKYTINKTSLRSEFKEIIRINDSLPDTGISVLIISVKKSRKEHIRQISRIAVENDWIQGVKFILFVDDDTDISDIAEVVWLSCNNIDPMRDCYYIETVNGTYPGLFIDGTGKSNELDDFSRNWPNVIIMNDETIRKVDEIWSRLGLGELLLSPSLKYRSLVHKSGAVSKLNEKE